MMPKVLNKRNFPKGLPFGSVYVGRPTKFGNPFQINAESERDDIVEKYIQYMKENPLLCEDAKRELKGKDLVCWCSPKRCHADILIKIANEET